MFLAAPAVAADGKETLLELSRDGVSYAPGTLQNVLDDSHGYIPGESRNGRLWVRNASKNAAYMSLAVVSKKQGSSATLPEYLSLEVATAKRRAAAKTLPGPGHCTTVFEKWTLSAGESLPLVLNLALALQAPNSTRNQNSTFDLVFVLQGIDGGRPVSGCAPLTTANPGGASLAVLPVSGGPAARAAQPGNLENSGEFEEKIAYAGTEMRSLPVLSPAPPQNWPVPELEHSNVVANIRSPWPWLVFLSACTYMLISFGRRRRTR
ncbi:hypothetical protein AAGW05_17700 [Arthrobacter sp. LAPM80]|uniref:hypothetical protein n=1 Tax=Arthrobacter sp. LAPM80 TaxID=3141788 RepID=UPI00398B898E